MNELSIVEILLLQVLFFVIGAGYGFLLNKKPKGKNE